MKLHQISDPAFARYGRRLAGYDFSELLDRLSEMPVPETGIVYEASVRTLENCRVFGELRDRGFGGMPIQIGYVSADNRVLNCLEYHKSSEFNIAREEMILVLGLESDTVNGRFDTSKCDAFLVPAGEGVELFATTLHYAPFFVPVPQRIPRLRRDALCFQKRFQLRFLVIGVQLRLQYGGLYLADG